MKQPTGQKSSAWFWVGVTLLSLSALWWLIIILAIADEPEAAGDMIFTGLIFTAIPIGIGIYCVRRGRKSPAVEVRRDPEPVYPTKPRVKPGTFYKVKGLKDNRLKASSGLSNCIGCIGSRRSPPSATAACRRAKASACRAYTSPPKIKNMISP